VNTIVLTGAGGGGYSGVNILYALICLFLLSVLGMVAVYKNYHGIAEGSGRSKTISRVLVLILIVLLLIEAFSGFGNINGLAGFGGARFPDAEAAGAPAGALAYWKAMTVLESLMWLGSLGWLCWCLYGSLRGVQKAAAPAPAAAAGATAPTQTK
jgi:hypothetical protein